MHARDWVTWHGFALNVTTDLRYFDLMVPCGIAAVEMTSVGRELPPEYEGSNDLGPLVRAHVSRAFAEVFQLDALFAPADAVLRELLSASAGATST